MSSSSSRQPSNGRSPLVSQQRQITSFFTKKPTLKPNPNSLPSSSPTTQNPNPSPSSPPSVQSKRKKPLLVTSGGDASSSPLAKGKSFGDGVVGKRIKVYWPLDETWYEGCVKGFDEKAGKHLVQYDDAEEELLVLGDEKIEWIEESAKKLKRLRRGSSSPMSAAAAVEEDIEEDLNDGDGSDDDSGDEDWGKGKNVENEVMSEDEDVELVDEDEDEGESEDLGVGKSRRKQGGKVESKKRKMNNGATAEEAPKKIKSESE